MTPFVIAQAGKYESDKEQKDTSIIAQRFEKEKIFTGKMGQDMNEYIATYNKSANDHELGDKQNFSSSIIFSIVMQTVFIVQLRQL